MIFSRRAAARILVAAALQLPTVPSRLLAVPAFQPHGRPPMQRSTCFVNRKAWGARAAALRASPRFASPISTTTYSVAVLRVDFSDETMSKTRAETVTFFNNLKVFYLENSYGYLTVNATVSNGGGGQQGAYRLPRTHAYYANGLSSKYSELAADAITAATAAGFSFTGHDHVMIYHAGEGAESDPAGGSNYIWSAYAPSELISGPTAGGKTFPGATFVPESELQGVDPLGVICHEYGHQLGLPDLYSTASGASKVGKWSVMDAGVYIGTPQGSNPAHFDAWSKLFLGFSSPETVSASVSSNKTMAQAETNRGAFLRVPISASSVGSENEYFLLEYRRTGGSDYTYDTSLPGQGLLIWHVDDSIASNSTRLAENTVNVGTPNLGVDLVEADATDSSSNGGDSTDVWGPSNLFQSPKANAYNGQDSGVVVSNVSSAGSAAISLSLKTTLSNPAITQVTSAGSVVVTGGDNGYANPSKGEKVLIGFRPASSDTVRVKIYSLSGDLVKEMSVQGTAGQTTTVPWTGTNSDGSSVTSGIYVVHVSGGGLDSVKKAAIAR